MQTYTHFLWAVVLSRWLKQCFSSENHHGRRCRWSLPPLDVPAVLFGSVLPDVALILTTVVCVIHDAIIHGEDNDNDKGDTPLSTSPSSTSWTQQLFSVWYFQSPWVKAEHNIFHSPVSLGAMIAVCYILWKKKISRSNHNNDSAVATAVGRMFWVFVSALFHATCDIPVHHDDGPLLLFPLNWNYRFHSPVSYYDPDYYGRQFAICEHVLDIVIVLGECLRCCCFNSYCCGACGDRHLGSSSYGGGVNEKMDDREATNKHNTNDDNNNNATMVETATRTQIMELTSLIENNFHGV